MSQDKLDRELNGPNEPTQLQIDRAEIERLKKALWRYGKHLASCPLWSSPNARCSCGWVEVRATLAPAQQSTADAFNASIAPVLP